MKFDWEGLDLVKLNKKVEWGLPELFLWFKEKLWSDDKIKDVITWSVGDYLSFAIEKAIAWIKEPETIIESQEIGQLLMVEINKAAWSHRFQDNPTWWYIQGESPEVEYFKIYADILKPFLQQVFLCDSVMKLWLENFQKENINTLQIYLESFKINVLEALHTKIGNYAQ